MGWLIDVLPLNYTDAVVVLGAALLGIAAGALGVFAVLRQRSLVGDALAHAALPGVAIAFILTGAKDPATLLVGAAIAGLIGALMMIGIERTSRIRPTRRSAWCSRASSRSEWYSSPTSRGRTTPTRPGWRRTCSGRRRLCSSGT